jgi:hypothetical protein
MGVAGSNVNVNYCVRFFPHFVRERLIGDHIVFNFHHEKEALRDYVIMVFSAAGFLQYEAVEDDLVGRIVMNLHPTVLAHAAFLERPRSRKYLINAVGLIEEKFSVLMERKRAQSTVAMSSGSSSRSLEASRNVPRDRNPRRCWNCGRAGHLRRDCRRQSPQSGNGQAPGRSQLVLFGR